MTREIKKDGIMKKFKVWCNRTKKWLKEDEYGLLANGKLIARSEYNEVGCQKAYTENSSVDATICFWTGLLDKNGKEICDGDIIQSGTEIKGYVRMMRLCHQGYDTKYWSVEGWGIVDDDKDEYSITELYEIEIIGNIQSNPELLK